MGSWGTGLYASDLALDLRSTVGALARLPLEGDDIVGVLCTSFPEAAGVPADEEHTTFWLVTADQLARKGIASPRAKEMALAIIDGGHDLAACRRLGMTTGDLKRRTSLLTELRRSLVDARAPAKSHSVLRSPQKLHLARGDVVAYPTSAGRPINPYLGARDGDPDWRQDGWAAMAIIDVGHAFGYLAWSRPLTIAVALTEKPTLEALRRAGPWQLREPGTLTSAHVKRMEIERLGRLELDAAKLDDAFGARLDGVAQAIHDVALSNEMSVAASEADLDRPRFDALVRVIGHPQQRSIPSLSAITGE